MTHLRIVIFTFITLALVSCQTPAYEEQGWASYIADQYAGRMTSSGQVYHPGYSTAAHNTLPFGTEVTVKNLYNGRSVKAMVNDRFPYYPGRVINLSRAAAQFIGISPLQLAQVKVTAKKIQQGGYSQPAYQQQSYPQQQAYSQQQFHPQQQTYQPQPYPQQQQSLVPNYPSQAAAPQPVQPQTSAPAARRSFLPRLGGSSTPAAPSYQGTGGTPAGLNTF